MNADPRLISAKRAARIVGVVLPILILVVSTALQLLWMPRMPNPAAVHWGLSGMPDGFGSPWQNVALLTGVNVFVLLLLPISRLQAKASTSGLPGATWASGGRFLHAFVLGLTVSLQTMAIGGAWVQLDAADARDTGSILWALIAGFAGGAVVGVVAYLLQPKLQLDPETGEPPAAPLALGGAERAVWVGEVKPSKPVAWAISVTVALLVALSVWMFTVERLGGWITLATLALIALPLATCMWFRVRIGPRGFEAKSVAGWPVLRVPAADVLSVVPAHINPLGEFGGWGLRLSGNRTGLVPRGGEGIVITRRSGRVLVVTLADAATAASVLSAAAGATDPAAGSGPTEPPRIFPATEGETP